MPIALCNCCYSLDHTGLGVTLINQKEQAEPSTLFFCTECATGKWHDLFPKETPKAANYKERPDGYYEWNGNTNEQQRR